MSRKNRAKKQEAEVVEEQIEAVEETVPEVVAETIEVSNDEGDAVSVDTRSLEDMTDEEIAQGTGFRVFVTYITVKKLEEDPEAEWSNSSLGDFELMSDAFQAAVVDGQERLTKMLVSGKYAGAELVIKPLVMVDFGELRRVEALEKEKEETENALRQAAETLRALKEKKKALREAIRGNKSPVSKPEDKVREDESDEDFGEDESDEKD